MTNKHVNYCVKVNSIAAHLFEVEQTIQGHGDEDIILRLPAWIPGSYMIRDFAKNIVSFVAVDEALQALAVTKKDKQTWVVTPGKGAVTIKLHIYAYDLSVRSAYINDQYAFFNGTSVFLEWQGYSGPYTVELQTPDSSNKPWQIATAMTPKKDASGSDFVANSYQELIDHPVLMGDLDIQSFTVGSVDFKFVLTGEHHADVERICNDVAKLCEHHLALFDKDVPIKQYWFMTLLCQAGFGGLEHSASTVLQYSREELPSTSQRDPIPDGYRTFLSLCSHEFFHTWHVKRNKPACFIDMDLSSEVYTEQLWIYEGFTSYIDDISLYRTGLIDADSYLQLLGQTMTRLKRNSGNKKQTVTESSFDAWTRFYQQDASAANNIVSYYAKGAEIALCLDLLLRQKSDNTTTIFDVVRQLWEQFGRHNIGSQIDTIEKIIHQEFNIDLADFFVAALYGVDPLPTQQLLSDFGVSTKLRARNANNDKGGDKSKTTALVDFGAQYTEAPMGVKVTQVLETTAAFEAGLHVGDIIIALGNWQVAKTTLQSILDRLLDQTSSVLHVLRDGRLLALPMQIHPAQKDTVYLETVDVIVRDVWLNNPKF
ncbi:PDZ domain-containing protein [Aliiglaciecola sp.]|nr:PDZ domain-containing protein [Aliiglaciecola sp.]